MEGSRPERQTAAQSSTTSRTASVCARLACGAACWMRARARSSVAAPPSMSGSIRASHSAIRAVVCASGGASDAARAEAMAEAKAALAAAVAAASAAATSPKTKSATRLSADSYETARGGEAAEAGARLQAPFSGPSAACEKRTAPRKSGPSKHAISRSKHANQSQQARYLSQQHAISHSKHANQLQQARNQSQQHAISRNQVATSRNLRLPSEARACEKRTAPWRKAAATMASGRCSAACSASRRSDHSEAWRACMRALGTALSAVEGRRGSTQMPPEAIMGNLPPPCSSVPWRGGASCAAPRIRATRRRPPAAQRRSTSRECEEGRPREGEGGEDKEG